MEERQDMIWKKLKKTKQRERVCQILAAAEKPMSAADIYQALLQQDGACSYAVSTVYRVLQAFEEKGLVGRTSLPDSDTALYEWNPGGHQHYAICLKCHKRIPLKECPFHNGNLQETEGKFLVTGHKVEVYGYCVDCIIP